MRTDLESLKRSFEKRLPLLVAGILFAGLAFIPFLLAADGFTPRDDVLRHAAKVISGKDWSDILVYREGIYRGQDSHPGWHFILGLLHGYLGLDGDSLVVFSFIFLWILICLPSIFLLRRPEIFVFLLLLFFLLEPIAFNRLFLGRPYLFSVFTLFCYLHLWDSFRKRPLHPGWMIVLTSLVALQVWIHANWYLLGLPACAVLVSSLIRRELKPPLVFACCALAGILAGAAMTGHPFEFLAYYIKHLYWALGEVSEPLQRVPELQPRVVAGPIVVLFLFQFALRYLSGRWPGADISHPAFILGLTGWLLSFYVARFWTDWGFPAMLVWMALDIQPFLEKKFRKNEIRRLVFALFVITALCIAIVTTKRELRNDVVVETRAIREQFKQDPDIFPGHGGVVYTSDMSVFFSVFYAIPHAPWKYLLGYEPGTMPEEDLAVYLAIKETKNLTSFEPWAEKMSASDRMIIKNTNRIDPSPAIPQLEWRFVYPSYWVGRSRNGKNP